MDGQDPLFEIRAAEDAKGGCPFGGFVGSQSDAKIRARILSKVEYLSHLSPEDYDRPLIDTLDGAIKELRFGPRNSLRVLFSLEQTQSLILLYGGERKQVHACDPALISEAKELRKLWLDGLPARKIDVAGIRKKINRKRLQWPPREKQ